MTAVIRVFVASLMLLGAVLLALVPAHALEGQAPGDQSPLVNPAEQPTQDQKPQDQKPAEPKAPEQPPPQIAEPQALITWRADLDRIGRALERDLTGNELNRFRDELDAIRSGAEAFARDQKPALAAAEARLAQLGPPPAADAPPEPDTVRRTREQLSAEVGAFSGHIKTAGVIAVRATQLMDEVQGRRRDIFSQKLFERVASPLSPTLWIDVAQKAHVGWRSVGLLVGDWWRVIPSRAAIIPTIALSLAVFFLLRHRSRAWIARDLAESPQTSDQPTVQRAAVLTRVTVLRALPALAAAATLYGSWLAFDLLPNRVDRLAEIALLAFSIGVAMVALIRTLMALEAPGLRRLPIADRHAPRLYRTLIGVAVVYALDLFVAGLNDVLFAPFSLTIAQAFFGSVLIAGLIGLALKTPLDPDHPSAKLFTRFDTWLKPLVWLAVIAILVAAVIGYLGFAHFLATQLVLTGAIAGAAYLLYLSIETAERELKAEQGPIRRWMRGEAPGTTTAQRYAAAIFSILFKAALILAAAVLILLQWGFTWEDVGGWLNALFFGFEVGSLRISLAAILGALGILIGGVLLTNAVQGWLDRNVLSEPRFQSSGMANSIRTVAGYAGVTAAILVAASYGGLDFTNLAIVAGALSVGIGFGLQSIVNNFVSGLILLVERPIKVGDWIVVGESEGIVRRISVRATEIETFDRSSIILPNSELMTSRVLNWTYRDVVGRVVIPVGVAYDSDPDLVMALLLEAARNHPLVLKTPEAFVVFEGFGDSSLDFTLRAFVTNINRSLGIRTELRLAILKSFRAHGIEIPFPQRDLHIKSVDETAEKALLDRAGSPKIRET